MVITVSILVYFRLLSVYYQYIIRLLQTPPGHSNTRKDSQRRNSSYSSGPSPRVSLKVDGGREGMLMLKQYCVLVGPIKQVCVTRYSIAYS